MYTIRQSEPYLLKPCDGFDAAFAVQSGTGGVVLIHMHASAKNGSAPLSLTFSWMHDNIDIAAAWSPCEYHNKQIRPDWGRFSESSAVHGAPIFSNISCDDQNRLTVACSDVKNRVGIRCGLLEESAELACFVRIAVDQPVESYEADIRIDTRDIPFWEAVGDASRWLETAEGIAPAPVPESASLPFYSTWYSFHHDLEPSRVLAECRYFKEAGCDALLVDGGWYKENNARGLGWTGDWQSAKNKLGDMKAFVDQVHALGMKFVLWYAVGFVGIHSDAYETWRDKRIDRITLDACPLDPRYPEVRAHVIGIWTRAVSEWGLDGFKLDFIDSIPSSAEVKPGMDTVSVCDAICRMMKDALTALRRLKPDILIEFRQSYTGPLMRSFGNMLRSGDCPNDSYTNRLNTLALRLFCGKTPVHSDMVMWSCHEPAEIAAFQLTNVLFSVPQVSVLHACIPDDHRKMVKHYLNFWKAHRRTLLEGEMFYRGYVSNFSYVSSRRGDEQIGAVYAGQIAVVKVPTDRVILINASKNTTLLIEGLQGDYSLQVTDCMGEPVSCGTVHAAAPDAFIRIDAPVSAYIELQKIPSAMTEKS